MALSTQPYKGSRDFYPGEMRFRKWMYSKIRQSVESYGYEEYDGPMLESFDLYAAKTGEEIVNQQLYWLMDRGNRKMAIRPEMTPTLARMVASKFNEIPRPIRWYSIPNLWRYERPQRGRLREHWQLNVDVLGGDPLYADVEIIRVAVDLIKAFKGDDLIKVRVNHRGLMDHFFKTHMKLESEKVQKLIKAIDSKNKMSLEKYQNWLDEIGISQDQYSQIENFFEASLEDVQERFQCEGSTHLSQVFELLEESGFSRQVIFDPTVLRGMDYYTGTVFEIYDTSPENNRAMYGGGRYDNLIGLFSDGKQSLSGIGFGMGDVTLKNFLETHSLVPEMDSALDVFVTLPGEHYRKPAEEITARIRRRGLKVSTPLGVGKFGVQLKQAAKLGARYAVLFGEKEFSEGKVLLKNLGTGDQESVLMDTVIERLQ